MMTTKSNSRSAFFILRVVLGAALCCIGVLLALTAMGRNDNTAGAIALPYKNAIGVGDTIAAFQDSTTWQWQLIPPMSRRRTHVAVTSGTDGVYALGGDTDRYVCSWGCGVTASAERYSSATGSWSAIAPMHKSRDYFAAATGNDGHVYAIGGWTPDGDVTNTAEVYSPDTDSWAFIATMPVRVAMEAATTGQDGRIYVLGGGPVMNQGTTNVLIYDPAVKTWSYGPPMLESLALLGAATGTDGRIYAITPNPEVYDPVSGIWSFLPQLPTARSYLAGAADRDGQIYALGGCCSPGALKEVDIYSPATNAWVIGSPMLVQRSTPGAALGGDGRLYAVGGSDDTFNLQSAEVLVAINRTCVSPPSGLISWWSGDKTAEDVQGVNNGTLLNGASFTKGIVGPGFVFDGVNDWVRIQNSPSLSQPRFTLDAWVYPTGRQGSDRHIISKDNTVAREYILALNADNKFHAFVRLPSGDYNLAGATVAQLDAWYHVAMTHDGITLKLYVNGQLDGTLNAAGDTVPTSNPVGIGANVVGTFFQGSIDEAQIFNRALTDAELLTIYQAGTDGQCKPEVFVQDISPYAIPKSGGVYKVGTTIRIMDVQAHAISQAIVRVTVALPDGGILSDTVTTDSDGNADYSIFSSTPGKYVFRVERVNKSGRQYNRESNVETQDQITIP